MDSSNTSGILRECKRIEEDSTYSAKGHFEAANFWSRIQFILGGLAAILTGVAGALAFNDLGLLAGSIAMFTAALTSFLTFLNPSERQRTHLMAGNDYKELQNQARLFREVELVSTSEIRQKEEKIKRLADQRNRLNQRSPQIPRSAFEKARIGIEQGESEYSVDKRI